MEVDDNETFKIKKEVYLISMVAVHNFIQTLTYISHGANYSEIGLMIEDTIDNFYR
jgi:hypothetical protein